jgi:hypothetical protein
MEKVNRGILLELFALLDIRALAKAPVSKGKEGKEGKEMSWRSRFGAYLRYTVLTMPVIAAFFSYFKGIGL